MSCFFIIQIRRIHVKFITLNERYFKYDIDKGECHGKRDYCIFIVLHFSFIKYKSHINTAAKLFDTILMKLVHFLKRN